MLLNKLAPFALASLLLILMTPYSFAKDYYSSILSMRERAEIIDSITSERISQLLPQLMDETNIDMWLMISREYNEDPVLKTFLPATWLSARRTTMLVFINEGKGKVKSLAVAPYKVGDTFDKAWDKKAQPNQWLALVELIEKYQPKKIGINQSNVWGHADGLVATEKNQLLSVLPEKYQQRLVSAEALSVRWLETRTKREVDLMKNMTAIAHQIISEGFSSKVVHPGKTSADDLVWWFRDKVKELKLSTWFHPSVSIQRKDDTRYDHENAFTNVDKKNIVLPGDLLHVDFGISYLRLNTDTQQHAYVLLENEQSAPLYLQNAFEMGNRVQDIFTNNFKQGRSGNEVLKMSRAEAIKKGLRPTIYTHPLGYHGHAAGTTLGMWDSQGGVAGSGDYPLHLNTTYSIELNAAVDLKEWNKEIRIMLEEDAFFDETGVWYLDGRQEKLLLIEQK